MVHLSGQPKTAVRFSIPIKRAAYVNSLLEPLKTIDPRF